MHTGIRIYLLPVIVAILATAPFIVAAHTAEDTEPVESTATPAQLGAAFERAQTLTNTLLSGSRTKSTGDLTAVARERNALMLELARTSPEGFLSAALQESERNRLPADVRAYVETPYDARSAIEIIHVDDFENHTNSHFRYSLISGGKLGMYQAGGTVPLMSGTQVQVRGYRLNDTVVAYPGTRGLEAVAAAAADALPTGPQKMLVVLIYDASRPKPPYTKNDMNSIMFNSSIQEFFKDQSYGNVSFTGVTTDWIGINVPYPHSGFACDLSYVDISYPEVVSYLQAKGINPRQFSRTLFMTYSTSGGCSTVGQTEQTWAGRTYRTSLSWSGVPTAGQVKPYVGRMNGVIFEQANVPQDSAFARCAAKARANTTAVILCTWNGSTIYDSADKLNFAKNYMTSQSFFTTVTAHELGHALGVVHANSWICSGSSFNTPDCVHSEYGNFADTMGYGMYGAHFNAYYKNLLGWLPAGAKKVVRASGKEKLTALSSAQGVKVLELQNPALDSSNAANSSVFLELRAPVGFDYTVSGGWAGIHVTQAIASRHAFNLPFTRLLNAKQATQPVFTDPAMQDGNNFNYPSHGIQLSNANLTAAAASVNIRYITPECRTYPMKTASFGATSVMAGDSLFLTVSLSNMNFPICGASSVKLASSNAEALGWDTVYMYPEDPISIDAGDTDYMFFEFKIPEDAPAGTQTLVIRIKDMTYGKSYRYTFPIQVVN